MRVIARSYKKASKLIHLGYPILFKRVHPSKRNLSLRCGSGTKFIAGILLDTMLLATKPGILRCSSAKPLAAADQLEKGTVNPGHYFAVLLAIY
jgi:hypothetical protein